ncbi:hypothetical protein D0868_15723, partial [Hortaea werneckii]
MGKEKSKGGVANKHLHARIAYLQQAASYLTLQGKEHQIREANAPDSTLSAPDNQAQRQNQTPIVCTENTVNEAVTHEQSPQQASVRSGVELPETGGLPLHLATHLRQVALKSQIRLRTDVKHSICKRCSSVLVEGQTSNKHIENKSKGGRKPHADVDSTSDQSLSSCSCYGGDSDWQYYALLLGCTQCDADGLGNYPLNFYQQWTAICNVFMNEGNAAAQSLVSYAEGSAMTSAFSESILPALQSMGNDDGVHVAVPVTVNGTSTTIGGASTGSDGADAATTASPLSIRSSSMPAATTASSTVASDTEEDAASETVPPSTSSSDEAAASATESSSTGGAVPVFRYVTTTPSTSFSGSCCTSKLDAPPPPRLHRSHSDPALPSHPLDHTWKQKQQQQQQTGQELPFLRELHGSSKHKRFYRQLSSTSPATFVPAVLLLLVLILQLFVLPRLPPHLQLFRPPPPARPTSCPTVPAFNPFVQELYCRVPQHTPSALYRQSPHSMALAAAAERVAAEFEYTKQDVQKGVKEFMRQMDEGLNVQGATLSQIPTYVTAVPNGTEKGLYMAVDLGGTNFRVCSIQLHGNSTFSLTQSKVKIPNELMTAKTSHQ